MRLSKFLEQHELKNKYQIDQVKQQISDLSTQIKTINTQLSTQVQKIKSKLTHLAKTNLPQAQFLLDSSTEVLDELSLIEQNNKKGGGGHYQQRLARK